eukprot:scaffold7.g3431.t1
MPSGLPVLLVASSTEGNITAWDLATGTALTSYKANACPPNALARLGRDYLLAAQLAKGLVHAWAWHKDHVHQRSFAPEPLAALAASPGGVFVAGGGASGAVHVWESSSGRLLKSWPAHYKAVSCLAFSDDGSVLLTGGQDTLVNAWLLAEVLDASAGQALQVGGALLQPLHSWSDHTLPVTALVVGAGGVGAIVASASLDRSVKVRSLGDGLLLRSFALPTALQSLALDPGEHALYAGTSTGTIYELDLIGWGDRGGVAPAAAPGPPAAGAAALPPGVAAAMVGHVRGVTCVALTGDAVQLVSGGEDGSVRIWDLRSRQQVRVLANPAKGPVTGLLVLDRPPFMQASGDAAARALVLDACSHGPCHPVGGAHLASASAAGASGRKGPRRPQPLAPLAKFANAPGALKPWEGGLVVIDGSASAAAAAGAADEPSSLNGGTASAAAGAASLARGDGWGADARATPPAGSGGGDAGAAGAAGDEAEALLEENARLRRQLAQATGLASQWGQLNSELQRFCAEAVLQDGR